MFRLLSGALRRRKTLIIAGGLAASGAVFILARFLPPKYVALSTVKAPESARLSPSDIENPEILTRALTLLGWASPSTSDAEVLRLSQALRPRLSVRRGESPTDLRIAARDEDPARAAAVANAAARAWVENIREGAPGGGESSEGDAFQRLEIARSSLKTAEEEMKKHLSRHGDGESPTADELDAQRNLLKGLLKIYTDRHPEVVSVREKIAPLEERLRRESDRKSQRRELERELRIAEENLAFLTRKKEEALLSAKEDGAPLWIPARAPLSPDGANVRDVLLWGAGGGMLLGLLVALLLESGGTSESGPEGADAPGGLRILAVLPTFKASGFFLSRAKRAEALRRNLLFFHPPESPVIEAYRMLRANVALSARAGGRPAPILAVGAAAGGIWKDIVAANLALMSARAGLKTLLIEADMRRPLVHWLFGLPAAPGLADALLGRAAWNAAVRGTSDFLFGGLKLDFLLKTPGIENFRLLPCGAVSGAPADILASPQMDRVLKEARSQFDLLILDCPDAEPFSDVLQLAPRADAMILVREADAPLEPLKRGKERLLNVKTHLSGQALVRRA